MQVKKAVVLAAGLGTRLRPLTCTVPKPLLPVWGAPMLAHVVEMLRDLGVTDIAVNCHYLGGQVADWCAANGCRASCEGEILGTGGALNPLRDWLGGEPFYLVNGDIVLDGFVGFGQLASFAERDDLIGLCLTAEEGPRTIEVEPHTQIVTNWHSDEAGYPGTFTYCGVALLKPKILEYVPPTGFSTIVEAYERAMADGRFLRAWTPENLLWTDAGTIARWVEVNENDEGNAFGALPQLRDLDPAHVVFLGARGSDRVFFRSGDKVAVLYDDARRGENARYAGHARWLKDQGVPVPEVLADRPADKTLVLEWAGEARRMTLEEYVKAVEALAHFNGLDASGLSLEPPFDAALYQWEHGLFKEHCLGTRFCRACPPAVEAELASVAARLLREPTALVHRDFQSTNVLWRDGALRIIDFQGMRLGAAAYDLASLVYDPYVELTEGERRALVKLYAKASGRAEVPEVVPFAAVQRLVQCLGAYGRLASVGQPQFGRFVLPALEHLLAAADEAGLDAVGALAEDLIAAERKAQGSESHKACTCGHGPGHDHGHSCTCGHHECHS